MRIMIFAAGGDIGGGKTHILSIAKQLSACNELKLVAFRKGVLSQEAIQLGIDTEEVDASRGFSFACKEAVRLSGEFKPDVIHCHGAKANVLGVMVKKKLGFPVMTTVHSDPKLDYLGNSFRQRTIGTLNEAALRRMDYYVAVSGRMKEILIERGFDPCSIFTVYNGIDFSGASEQPRPQKPESDTITVGIAARLTAVKDIKTLVRAFACAYAQDKRLRLSIAGSGEDKHALEALCKELGIAEVTRFEGWIDDVNEYFRKVDINVLASLSETFPYSLLEGAYEHCPAIATDVGGIPDLIEDGVSGFLFKPGDWETFASHILRLAGDPQLRTRLAEALFEKAKNEFSLERMKQSQQEIYENAVARSRQSGRRGAVLCGAYGRGNAGDEAILKAILSQLRSVDADMPFWVMSRSPEDTKKKECVRSYFIFNVFAFLKSLKQARLFVNGGGSLIQDITSSRSLYFYLFTLKAAKRAGCKVIMYGCGIGPLNKEKDRKLAGRILNETADVITLRDSSSLQLLKDIGVSRPEIILAADPVFSLEAPSSDAVDAAFRRENIDENAAMIGFCLRSWPGFDGQSKVAQAAQYAYEKYGLLPVFYPIEYPNDLAISEETASLLNCPSAVCREKHSPAESIGMLGRMDAVCGMRLHSLIFGASGGAPVIGLSYDVKVDSFIKDIGSDAVLSASDFSAEQLCSLIDKALSGGRDAGESVKQAVAARESLNLASAAKLLAAE